MRGAQVYQCRRIARALTGSLARKPSAGRRPSVALPTALSDAFARADVAPRVIVRAGILVLCIGGGVTPRLGLLAGLVVTVVGGLAIWLVVGSKARRRARELDRDLPTLLTSIASSVRAGLDPLSALLIAREFFPTGSVVREELESMRQGLAEGGDENTLIESWLADFGSSDIELFKRCLVLSRRQGSSLAEPLHRVTRVIRQRQSFRRKTKAALAVHRMSAIGIALCAITIGAIQAGMNAKGIEATIHHPAGIRFLLGGGLLMVLGLIWMVKIGSEAKG